MKTQTRGQSTVGMLSPQQDIPPSQGDSLCELKLSVMANIARVSGTQKHIACSCHSTAPRPRERLLTGPTASRHLQSPQQMTMGGKERRPRAKPHLSRLPQ